jgi:hypothetical protein
MQFYKQSVSLLAILAGCFSYFKPAAQAPTSGLLAYAKFNGNTINSAAGTVSFTANSTSWTTNSAGAANAAIQFSGSTSSYVGITDNGALDFSGNFTMTMGFYSTGANGGVFDNNLNYGGYGVYYHTGLGGLRFNCGDLSIAAGTLPNNTWRALAFVKNGSTCSVYINGVFAVSGTVSTFASSYTYAPVVGQLFSGSNYLPSNGRMDELRFYNRALTASEILATSSATLPLKMGSFTASAHQPGVMLNWETLSEENSSHFEIEKSIDGNCFERIGSVQAKGNSASRVSYSFHDAQPLLKNSYYRLRLVDLDNSYTYSRVVLIKSKPTLTIQVFPNPAKDVLQVQLPATETGTVRLSIININGRQLQSSSVSVSPGNNAISISVKELPAGNYYLVVKDKAQQQSSAFIKQ